MIDTTDFASRGDAEAPLWAQRWLAHSGKWGLGGSGFTAGESLAVRLEPLCLPVTGVSGTCHHAQITSWELET